MRLVSVNGFRLQIYDDIEELPIQNFQKFNKYLLVDAGVGSNVDDIEAHIAKMGKFITSGDKKSALQELENMRVALYTISEGLSPKNMAFICLIHSINGKRITDYSETNLKAIQQKLVNIRQSFFSKLLEEIKKKIDYEIKTYFPQLTDSSMEKEACSKLKLRTLKVLESVTDDKDNADEIQSIDEFFLSLLKPHPFQGNASEEIAYDKRFESLCLGIAQRTNQDARSMTVLQFYNTLLIVSEQVKEEQKLYRQR